MSSIIIDIGGIAAYPSIISDGKNLRELFLTVSHEWLHQYLIFHPLGRSYFSSPEMKEINETLANIFSNKLLDDLCKKNFELKNEVCGQYKKSNKTEFNYREFIKSGAIFLDLAENLIFLIFSKLDLSPPTTTNPIIPMFL